MRASTAVVIFCFAAQVAPSYALNPESVYSSFILSFPLCLTILRNSWVKRAKTETGTTEATPATHAARAEAKPLVPPPNVGVVAAHAMHQYIINVVTGALVTLGFSTLAGPV
jgi:aspartate aminotransferase-like enzyme